MGLLETLWKREQKKNAESIIVQCNSSTYAKCSDCPHGRPHKPIGTCNIKMCKCSVTEMLTVDSTCMEVKSGNKS